MKVDRRLRGDTFLAAADALTVLGVPVDPKGLEKYLRVPDGARKRAALLALGALRQPETGTCSSAIGARELRRSRTTRSSPRGTA